MGSGGKGLWAHSEVLGAVASNEAPVSPCVHLSLCPLVPIVSLCPSVPSPVPRVCLSPLCPPVCPISICSPLFPVSHRVPLSAPCPSVPPPIPCVPLSPMSVLSLHVLLSAGSWSCHLCLDLLKEKASIYQNQNSS